MNNYAKRIGTSVLVGWVAGLTLCVAIQNTATRNTITLVSPNGNNRVVIRADDEASGIWIDGPNGHSHAALWVDHDGGRSVGAKFGISQDDIEAFADRNRGGRLQLKSPQTPLRTIEATNVGKVVR